MRSVVIRRSRGELEAVESAEDLAEPQPTDDPDRVIPAEDAFLMADMLRAVVQEGTGWRLKALGRPLGGKTGTTNDQADAWFMGFSPGIATGVGWDTTRATSWATGRPAPVRPPPSG